MTLKEAKMTIYANVVYACEKAGLSPMTIKMVKDACDTVIALADQADTPQTGCNANQCVQRVESVETDTPQTELKGSKRLVKGSEQTDEEYINTLPWIEKDCPWK